MATINGYTVRCEVEQDASFVLAKSANGFDYYALIYKGKETGDYVQVRVPNGPVEVNSAFLRNETVTKLPEDEGGSDF